MALFGAAPFLGIASEALAAPIASSSADDYYAKLGVEKIINAAGTYTYLTAACMPPQVLRAVAQAALHPVRLKDLQQASGEYIAKKLRCEGAVVTSGASAALTLATAACITSANDTKPDQIPESVGQLKNEVIVQKAHRYEYDHVALRCPHRRGRHPGRLQTRLYREDDHDQLLQRRRERPDRSEDLARCRA
jgi:L-seryl-tRNA(Ser) seleniumtransferase